MKLGLSVLFATVMSAVVDPASAVDLRAELVQKTDALTKLDINFSPLIPQRIYFKKLSDIGNVLKQIHSDSEKIPNEVYLPSRLFLNITDYVRSNASRAQFFDFLETYADLLERPERFEDFNIGMSHHISLQSLLYLWGRSKALGILGESPAEKARSDSLDEHLNILRNRFFYGVSQQELGRIPQHLVRPESAVSSPEAARVDIILGSGKFIHAETADGVTRVFLPPQIFEKLEPRDRFKWQAVKAHLPKGIWMKFPQMGPWQIYLEDGRRLPDSFKSEPVEYFDGPGFVGRPISLKARSAGLCARILRFFGR